MEKLTIPLVLPCFIYVVLTVAGFEVDISFSLEVISLEGIETPTIVESSSPSALEQTISAQENSKITNNNGLLGILEKNLNSSSLDDE